MTPEQIIVQVLAAHWGADELDDEIVQVAGPVVVALREAGFDLDHEYRPATERECMNGAHALMELFVWKERSSE